jgi:pimeloyl-ACP methyl ester carboxylesterase
MCQASAPDVTMAPVHSERVGSTDGVELALHDLGGVGPTVLLCHPTGFHGAAWAPVAAELARVAHCWAVDFRGHGDSTVPVGGDMAWRGAADDVLAVADRLGVSGGLGVGHSMGGAALLMAEQRRPGTFRRLWLYEPIVFPRVEGGAPRGGMAETARRRRRRFADRDAAYAHYAAKPPLSSLDPAALRAYVDHGFRDDPGDGVVLKCTPEVEAATFDAGVHANAFDALGQVASEVVVAVGGDGQAPAMLGPLVADVLPHGRLERHPQLSHFGPLEGPPVVAAAIRAALGLA